MAGNDQDNELRRNNRPANSEHAEEKHSMRSGVFSLVHHVELTRAKWWERSVQDVVLSAVHQSQAALTLDEIGAVLRESGQLEVPADRLHRASEQLLSQGALLRVDKTHLTLSEAARKEIAAATREVQECEAAARIHFLHLVRQQCPEWAPSDAEATAVWEQFNNDCLIPLVRDAGAETWSLLSGSTENRRPSFDGTTETIAVGGSSLSLGQVCEQFLQRPSPAVRAHVLRLLNLVLVLNASSLNRGTIETIAGGLHKGPTFTVFVDTNLLYSALGLHDNPLNSATTELLACLRNLPASIKVHLAILPQTVDEFRRSITFWRKQLRGIRVTDNIAVALEASGLTLSGVAMTFIDQCRRSGRAITAESYFDPYLHSVQVIAQQRGISFHNENLDSYATDHRVVDDIIETDEYYKSHPGIRAKSYEELRHDYSLWYVTFDKRSQRAESVADAKFWILTVDHRLLAYDARQQRQRISRLPVCISPEAFLSMLQFWSPRSESLERALVGSFRNPFLFRPFDAASERVTLQILGSLSRFENLADLPPESAAAVLVNEALRQRIEGAKVESEAVALVREALIAENRAATLRIAELRTREQAASEVLSQNDQRIGLLESTNAQLLQNLQDREHRLQEQSSQMHAAEQRDVRLRRRAAFVVLLPALGVAAWVGSLFGFEIGRLVRSSVHLRLLGAGFLLLGAAELWLAMVRRSNWGRVDTQVRRVRRFLRALEAAAVFGPIGNLVYNLLRP